MCCCLKQAEKKSNMSLHFFDNTCTIYYFLCANFDLKEKPNKAKINIIMYNLDPLGCKHITLPFLVCLPVCDLVIVCLAYVFAC